jgi:hypothetical protein
VADLDRLMAENKEQVLEIIRTDAPDAQLRLEEMADRMKNMWSHASDNEKATWNELKKATFGVTDIHTKLLDVICSFESRWIPREHCACPICWEGGLTQKFSNLPDFVNHMKNVHHVGWKNVKDYWCMIFSRAIGKCFFRTYGMAGMSSAGYSPGHGRYVLARRWFYNPIPTGATEYDGYPNDLRHYDLQRPADHCDDESL